MLIPFTELVHKYKIDNNKKILHIGAHECEERSDYNLHGFTDDKVIWIEGNENIVNKMKTLIPSINMYNILVSDIDGSEVDFIITNNGQSSSILELDEHLKEHPGIYEVQRYKQKTLTINTFLDKNNINKSEIEFVNIDIQGAELLALKGMINLLPYVKYLYLEVNIKHLYKDCALINEIDDFLTLHGFRRCETYLTQYGWGDALYIKNDIPYYIFNNCDHSTNGELFYFNSIKNSINTIFDIGSRYDSEYINFEGEVHYFEPVQEFLTTLKTFSTKNKCSYYNNFGLSDKNEIAWYYPSFQSFYNRIRSCSRDDSVNRVELHLKKAKNYINDHNITNIDFIKIDTEGCELRVLKGFEDTLNMVKIIQFEYGGTFLDNNVKLSEIIDYLKLYNFNKFYYLAPDKLVEITDYSDHYQYCNIISLKM